VKPESLPSSGGFYSLLYKWSSGQQQYGIGLGNTSGTNNLRFVTYATCGGSNVNKEYNYTVSTSAWTHLVWTYNAGTVYYYVNGSSIGNTTGSDSTLPNCTGGTSIGTLAAGQQWFYDGLIDEVTIDNEVWSATTITELYNNGVPLPYTYTAPATTSSSTATTTTSSLDDSDLLFMLAVIIFFLTFIWFGHIMSVFRKK